VQQKCSVVDLGMDLPFGKVIFNGAQGFFLLYFWTCDIQNGPPRKQIV